MIWSIKICVLMEVNLWQFKHISIPKQKCIITLSILWKYFLRSLIISIKSIARAGWPIDFSRLLLWFRTFLFWKWKNPTQNNKNHTQENLLLIYVNDIFVFRCFYSAIFLLHVVFVSQNFCFLLLPRYFIHDIIFMWNLNPEWNYSHSKSSW